MSISPRRSVNELNSAMPFTGSRPPRTEGSIIVDFYPSPTPSGRSILSAESELGAFPKHEPNVDMEAPGAELNPLEVPEKVAIITKGGPADLSAGEEKINPDSKASPNSAPAALDLNTAFWKAYNDAGDAEDKEFVKAAGSDLDTLLIFAGLFSATNTAFIIESYKSLKPDPVETTNKILISVFQAIRDPSQATLDASSFTTNPRDIRINAYFFTSLCCSLSAAFGAVLAKQWLTQYDQDSGGTLKEPAARGRERHGKYKGRDDWHLEDVIVTLPTLLQLSLFFFFVGLVDFLWPLSDVATSITLSFTVATFLFYITTIAISVFNVSAPFQTRLSHLLRSLPGRIWAWKAGLWPRSKSDHAKALQNSKVVQNPVVVQNANLDCFSYLLNRISKLDDLRVLADAFISLSADLDRRKEGREDSREATIIASFVDLHLKPVLGPGHRWSIPNLYSRERLPLLKVLKVLVRKWKAFGKPLPQTALYPDLDTTSLFNSIPGELRKSFLADPKDTESCRHIVDILHILPDDTAESQEGWLQKNVTKNLEDENLEAQRNTLAVLDLVTRARPDKRRKMWEIVKSAKANNPELKKFINSTVWSQLSGMGSEGALDSANPPLLLEWMTMSDDMNGLADALEAVPYGSGSVLPAAQASINAASETLFKSHLKPTLDGWLYFTNSCGRDVNAVLRILHVLIVKWKCLASKPTLEANPECTALRATPMVSVLRAELWEIFTNAPEDQQVVRIVTDIYKNLPTTVFSNNDATSPSMLQKVSTGMSRQLQSSRAEPSVLKHCFSLLCSNAEALINFKNFRNVLLISETARPISDHLASTMWDKDTPDLEDFWTATFRVQLLPVFSPDELHNSRFVEYLHLWFKRYVKLGATASTIDQIGNSHAKIQTQLYWAYLLSLQRLVSNRDSPKGLEELKRHNHQSHLRGLLDVAGLHSYPTWTPLALHLLVALQPNDPSREHPESVNRVVDALASGSISIQQMSRDIREYNATSRVADESDKRWCNETSNRVGRVAGRMSIRLIVSQARSGLGSEEASDRQSSGSLSNWMNAFNDTDGLASALEELEKGSEGVSALSQPVVQSVLEVVVVSRLKCTPGLWYQLPSLHDHDRKSLLRVLHVVAGKWGSLEPDLKPGAKWVPPLNTTSLVSSLRAELWTEFQVRPEDAGMATTIANICRNLPTPWSFTDDKISTIAAERVMTDMSTLFQNSETKPIILQHCFSLLCSNADFFIPFTKFHSIRIARKVSYTIPNYLRTKMWVGPIGETADIDDFWRATFSVQLLPVFFFNELPSMKFAKYLHLWFERYAKHEPEAETETDDRAPPRQTTHSEMRQAELYWAYMLTLQRLLVTAAGPERTKELKDNNHDSHLLEILDGFHLSSYSACAPLALRLLLRLWSTDTSSVTAGGVKGIVNGLASGSLSFDTISADILKYSESSRVDNNNVPYDQQKKYISQQVARNMGRMMVWMHDYLKTAAQRGLAEPERWQDTLDRYNSWCGAVEWELGQHERDRLSKGLRELRWASRSADVVVMVEDSQNL